MREEIAALQEDVTAKEKKADSLSLILEARQSAWDQREASFKSQLEQAHTNELELTTTNKQVQSELSTCSQEAQRLQELLQSRSAAAISREQALSTKITNLDQQLSQLKQQIKVGYP